MRLQASSSVWLRYEVDGVTGRYSRHFVPRRGFDHPISGYASVESTNEHGRLLFCLYRWDDELVFRAGTRTWIALQSDLQFEFQRLSRTKAEFRVIQGGQESFRCTYNFRLRALWGRIDVTYDGLDFTHDHFLAQVGDRARAATENGVTWVDGARHEQPG